MKAAYKELFFSRITDFLELYLARQIGRSQETVRSYRFAMLIFYKFISDYKNINPMKFRFTDCTHALVLDYSGYLKETLEYKPSSINQRIAALKSYAKYVSDDDVSLLQMRAGIESIPLQTVPKIQRPVISKEALSEMFNIPETSKFSLRDKTILIMMFDTALRVGELVRLKIGDLHLDSEYPYIYVFGKGNKERVVALSDKARDHLKNYLIRIHFNESDLDAPLFYTKIKGNITPMSTRNVERIVDKYSEQVAQNTDIPDSVYPHMFRRTRATGLYQDGVPLEMVSRLLGHRYIETTKTYAYPSIDQLKNAIERSNSEEPEEPLWKGKEDEIAKKFGFK